jgi:hypothetical protein
MNDWYNDPPDWYMNLEDAILDDEMPEDVKVAVQKALDDWNEQQNKKDSYDY